MYTPFTLLLLFTKSGTFNKESCGHHIIVIYDNLSCPPPFTLLVLAGAYERCEAALISSWY